MKRILIIEDNEILLFTMQYILEKEGYQLNIAKTGKEAISLLAQYEYSLILTDIMLPYSNGYEIIGAVRQGGLNCATPIIIVSALQNYDSIVEGFDVGADDYLKKPFSPPELLARVKSRIHKG